MPNPRQFGIKIEDWMGIDRSETAEQMQDKSFFTLQNLYERKIGELQRRGGSQLLTNTSLPSHINSIDQDFLLYDKILGKTKLLKVGCDAAAGTTPITNANVTMSFVSGGHWGDAPVGITNAYNGCDSNGIQLVATGFGRMAPLNSALTTGLPVSGDTKKLQVVIVNPGIQDSNITGIDVYASVIGNYVSGSPNNNWIWVGHIDLIATPTGTFNFTFGPITLGADPGGTPEVGNTDTTWTLTQGALSGNFVVGKTYWVALLCHRVKYDTLVNSRNYWYAKSVKSITIQPVGPNGNTSISVTKASGGSAATMIAIGTHPQLLKPVMILNNGSTFSINVTGIPHANMQGVVNFIPASSTVNDGQYIFNQSDYGLDEMFTYVDGNSNFVPVAINNYVGRNTDVSNLLVAPPWTQTNPGPITVSSGASWSGKQYFSQTQELMFLVPIANWNYTSPFSGFTGPTHNIVISDGMTASMAVMDYNCASPPRFSYVGLFQEHVTGGGGAGVGRNQLFFSNVLAPFNWSVPGATSLYQYVQCESTGEDIIGQGTYTNTANLGGPIEQIIIAKRSSLWVLSSLPVYSSGSNNNSFFTELSRKAGCSNIRTMVNTEIGTIITGVENVWLIRGTGEPLAIGDQIRYFLRSEDPTQSVDPTNWNAVYHDGHYKLAFSQPGSSTANQELWLNINKMKRLKLTPCWYGPMIGRECSRSMVEDQFNDTIIPKRISVDMTNKRWYWADREDFSQDFGASLSFVLQSKYFGMKDDMKNKLFMEQMWKMKVDASFTFSEQMQALNDVSGVVLDVNNRTVNPTVGYVSLNYAQFVSLCRAKLHRFFPASRGLMGENLAVIWSYTGDVYFTIAGFSVFYSEIGRRPGLSGG